MSAPIPAGGMNGSTDASHAGNLTLRADLPATNGTVRVAAASATEAVAKALSGTITVTLSGQATGYAFGVESVGTAAASHKAFLAVPRGAAVDVMLEDLAGSPSSDWDYNDRSWEVRVAAAPAPTPGSRAKGAPAASFGPSEGGGGVTGTGGTGTGTQLDPWVWEDSYTHETASVWLDVATEGTDHLRWTYTLTNNSLSYQMADLTPGINSFLLMGGDMSGADDLTASNGWVSGVGSDWVNWLTSSPIAGPYVAIGQTATFSFRTPPQPKVEAQGVVVMAGFPYVDSETGQTVVTVFPDLTPVGKVDLPGTPPHADIDIDGSVAGAAFTEATEETIGGLVVRNVDNNKTPRKPVIIQQILGANNEPFPNVKVKVTGQGGSVDLYDASAGGNKVPTGTLLDNAILPKTFWAQGVAGSTKMRDVKLAATPVLGNVVVANGADEVAFTVLWVDVVVATDGSISPDNDKKQNYKNWTVDKTYALGLQNYNYLYGDRIGWGVEARGKVYPADFAYPDSNLRLERDIERRSYVNEAPSSSITKTLNIPPGNDNGPPRTYDANPIDSNGFIYEFDAPGIGYTAQPVGTIVRYRANHYAIASITIDGTPYRASGIYVYFFRISATKTGPAKSDWNVIDPVDIPGDKQAKGPDSTKLSIIVE